MFIKRSAKASTILHPYTNPSSTHTHRRKEPEKKEDSDKASMNHDGSSLKASAIG